MLTTNWQHYEQILQRSKYIIFKNASQIKKKKLGTRLNANYQENQEVTKVELKEKLSQLVLIQTDLF